MDRLYVGDHFRHIHYRSSQVRSVPSDNKAAQLVGSFPISKALLVRPLHDQHVKASEDISFRTEVWILPLKCCAGPNQRSMALILAYWGHG